MQRVLPVLAETIFSSRSGLRWGFLLRGFKGPLRVPLRDPLPVFLGFRSLGFSRGCSKLWDSIGAWFGLGFAKFGLAGRA